MNLKERIKNTPFLGTFIVSTRNVWRRAKKKVRDTRIYKSNLPLLAKNSVLKNKYKGKRIFILSAGPSMKTQDLSGLENEVCISLGNVFVHPLYSKVHPEFHLFASSHTPITDEQWYAWMQEAEKHFFPNQNIVMSVTDKYIIDRGNFFQKQNQYYYYTDEFNFNRFNRDIDFTKLLPPITTQVHWAIYLAIYLGASEIYLLGCDHNWMLTGTDKDEKTGKENPKHFYNYKDYALAQKGYIGAPTNMETQFKSYVKLWELYRYIKRYADSHRVTIVNLTPGSLLDIFPRSDLKDVLKEK